MIIILVMLWVITSLASYVLYSLVYEWRGWDTFSSRPKWRKCLMCGFGPISLAVAVTEARFSRSSGRGESMSVGPEKLSDFIFREYRNDRNGNFIFNEARDLERTLAASQEREKELAESLSVISSSAAKLRDMVGDKFGCKDQDALTLYFASLLAGIAQEWAKNPPPNGFTSAVEFPTIGKLELNIKSINGKSAGVMLQEAQERERVLTERVKRLREAATLCDLMFKRQLAAGCFLGDDEHEAWSAITAALSAAGSQPDNRIDELEAQRD